MKLFSAGCLFPSIKKMSLYNTILNRQTFVTASALFVCLRQKFKCGQPFCGACTQFYKAPEKQIYNYEKSINIKKQLDPTNKTFHIPFNRKFRPLPLFVVVFSFSVTFLPFFGQDRITGSYIRMIEIKIAQQLYVGAATL